MSSDLAVRRRVSLALVAAGAIAGAIVGATLTVLGKIVAGAPPATFSNYVWNATVFGAIGAVVTPTVIWSGLRRVPLWRTVVEPLAAGIGAAVTGVLLGSGVAFLILPPLAIGAAVFRLNRVYRDKSLPRQSAP